jgi:LemA protein
MNLPLLAVAVAVPALLLVGGALLQNRLASGLVAVRGAFAGIEVQLQRRHDLVPRLVEAVKGAMAHEREVLARAIEARGGAERALRGAAAGSTEGLGGAEAGLESAIAAVLLRVEAYPTLRTSENVLALQEELVTSENRVAFARHAYNDSVMRYNTLRSAFPSNLVASLLRYEEASLLEWPGAGLATPPRSEFASLSGRGEAAAEGAAG